MAAGLGEVGSNGGDADRTGPGRNVGRAGRRDRGHSAGPSRRKRDSWEVCIINWRRIAETQTRYRDT